MGQLRITDGKGFHLEFDSGIILSAQIGRGNYSSNYDFEGFEITRDNPLPPAGTAEIACWLKGGGPWLQMDGDTVAGYVPIGRVISLIAALSTLPNPANREAVQEVINSIILAESA